MIRAGIPPAIIVQGSARQGGKSALPGFLRENSLAPMS
jgi:hypothetical protein